jgi:hypothetical protein
MVATKSATCFARASLEVVQGFFDDWTQCGRGPRPRQRFFALDCSGGLGMSLDLEERYPLRIPAQIVRDAPLDPEPPIPLEEINLERWKRIPLSKRRLAVCGPLQAGQEAARMAAIILAAECAAAGIPLEVALHLCMEIAFTTAQTGRRKVGKQLPKAAQFGYQPPNGRPILTGCCRDPRTAARSALGTKLRGYMAPYCDGACAASCQMLKAVRYPEQSVMDTDYAHIAASDLWLYGSGYGQVGRQVYEQLALLATLTTDRIVEATASYMTLRLNGTFSLVAVKRVLRKLHDDGLAVVVSHSERRARRLLPVLTPEALTALETRLGVQGKRAANVREAQREPSRYGELLYEMLTDEEKLAAWGGH